MSQLLTVTGRRFDPWEPDADLIDPRDITHALAHLCRFNGHTREYYSVAQHSCMVADLVPEKDKLAALLHDAAEAYLGNTGRPLRERVHVDAEDWIWERICTCFNIDCKLPATVRHADLVALATERRDLMPADPAVWDCLIGIEPTAETISPWTATEVRLTFHQRLMDQLATEHRRKAA